MRIACAPAERWRRSALAATLAVALSLSACGGGEDDPGSRPASAVRANPAFAPVDRLLERTLPAGAGGTVLAVRDGEVVHCKGFGLADREAKRRADCDTAYDIGSITKQFTAAAILKLEILGRLEVTDRLSEFVDALPPDKREITLKHLLTHTSGLPGQLGDDYEPLSREELLDQARRVELRSRPGAKHAYSNLGYSLLAAVIEEASGVGYEEFLAEQLFAPAGMTQTGYVLPQWNPDRVAVEYDEHGEPAGRPFEHPWAADGPHWNLRGNGGLISTARDISRWHVALEGEGVLPREAKRELFEPRVLEQRGGSSYYGYGWVVSPAPDGRIVWHDGGNGLSYAVLARFVDHGTMVFWVTNHVKRAGKWDLGRQASSLTTAIAERLGGGS